MDKREKNMLVREKLGFLWRMLKGVTLGCIGALAIYLAEAIANPIVFITILSMPLSGVGIPILRAVIGYVVSVGAIFALTVIARVLNARHRAFKE